MTIETAFSGPWVVSLHNSKDLPLSFFSYNVIINISICHRVWNPVTSPVSIASWCRYFVEVVLVLHIIN